MPETPEEKVQRLLIEGHALVGEAFQLMGRLEMVRDRLENKQKQILDCAAEVEGGEMLRQLAKELDFEQEKDDGR